MTLECTYYYTDSPVETNDQPAELCTIAWLVGCVSLADVVSPAPSYFKFIQPGRPRAVVAVVMGRPWAMDFTDSDNAPRGELPKPPGFSESSSHDTVRRAPCIRTGGLG